MNLRALLPLLAQSVNLADIANDSDATIPAPLGAIPAMTALLAADEYSGGRLQVVVTPSGRDADDLAAQLTAYIPAEAIDVFPSWETLPHERLSPRSDTVARRLKVLRRLAHPEEFPPLRVLAMPVRALLQPVVVGLGDMHPVRVRVGDVIDFDQLGQQLIAAAYERVDMVESRGQFAVRGGIIDVFPPTEPHPLRLEFFGDEVESIRSFAVADQRSMEDRRDLYAPPCREILLTDAVRARAAAAIPDFPGAADMLIKLAHGIAVEGMESLAPILAESMHSLVHDLPSGSRIICTQPERLQARAESLLATSDEFLAAAWSAAAAGGEVPLTVNTASFSTVAQTEAEARAAGLAWWTLGSFAGVAGGAVAGGANISDTGSIDGDDVDADGALVGALREPQNFAGDVESALVQLGKLARQQWYQVVLAGGAGLAKRFTAQLADADIPARYEADLPRELTAGVVYVTAAPAAAGFIADTPQLAVWVAEDIVSRRRSDARANRSGTSAMPKRRKKGVDPLQLHPGDYVVHERHGVGQFVKLAKRSLGGSEGTQREYVVIEYAPSKRGEPRDQLWVPTDQLDQVSKYAGGDAPGLNKMGGADWARTKSKARAAVRQIAKELIRLYAQRRATKGHAFSPDTPWQRELEDAFEFVETPDQFSTIEDVKRDMESPEPMDRLISGDVGYGKTEIAVRAAFKAVMDHKQVAVLAPTTLLVQQHLETFRDRYAGFPVRVESLSRFQSEKETAAVVKGLKDGTIDVVIGTHKLLTGDVRFKDLGLVVIDEEQRFGVEHKETLKQLYPAVDVLAMSATPIPRTLEMAVTGIRQMSTLATPPEERHPILTYVGAWESKQVSAAIKRELLREGQVFYVHNRTQSIYKRAAQLAELVPEARIGVAHGKMSEAQLAGVIEQFWHKEIDVLVCTTIVETGLDIANANTLIVEDAHKFGLSQLHQLRGRVGRGRERAYAYFLYPAGQSMTETAIERLRTIASHTELGAGIQVALKDLEIRGAGNLLGGEQSGHIAGVGFDLYIRMVGEAVAQLTGQDKRKRAAALADADATGSAASAAAYNLAAQEPVESGDVRIELPIDAYVPQEWVASERLRLEIYAKIAATRSDDERSDVRAELVDRYGVIPPEVNRLFRLAQLRERAASVGISEITLQGRNVRFAPVELADSRHVRLRRLYPRAVTKAAVRVILVPLPEEESTTGIKLGGGSGKLVSNDAAMDFVEQFIHALFIAS
ncbi:MAG: transcription-repair coupling factor [Actinomycetaceae bacterium]|nr:transcription-repair coupling factor [Arcanobacterium sp.]MDD7687421.1 transcription-repair coupling factor [Actinomycetaceae bacterium]MDY5272895.1 transcription-repair coupling factor [Arcanobacterium sp.]